MATITAAAGGGNWTTGATWVGGVAPSAADDAVLNAGSGAITINAGAVARSLDCTGYTSTLTHTAAVTLTLGDATAGAGNIALKLVNTMTYTLGSVTTSAISYVSTSATQQTITSGTRILGNYTINGAGSSYILTDANSTATLGVVTLAAGTFDTNSQACSWGNLTTLSGSTRTLTLGSSAITLKIGGNAISALQAGMTVTANTAVVTMNGAISAVSNGNVDWNGMSIIMTGSGIVTIGSGVFANVTRTGTAAKTDVFSLSSSTTITGVLTISGNSATNRMLVQSSTVATARVVSAASVVVSNADFVDITGAGAASWDLSAVPGGSGDCGGNSGITFETPITQTHTASAGGNWSDVTKWTSRVPLPQDDVIIDGTTTGTIAADMPRLGKSIDFTGFAGTASFNSVPNALHGSWTSSASMTISGTSSLTLNGRGSYAITSAGKTFTQAVTVIAYGGTYTLQDALTTNGGFFANGGTVTTNNHTLTCANFSGLAVATINMGSSTLNLTTMGTANIFVANGMIFNAGTSNVVISTASVNTRSFFAGTTAFSSVTYTVAGSTGTLLFGAGGVMSIGTLNFSDATNARTLTIAASATVIIRNVFNVNGTPGKLMTINSSIPGTAGTLSKPSGVVNCDYLSIQDSTVTGGASWYAGINSTNVSGNTGWFFTAYSSSTFLEFI